VGESEVLPKAVPSTSTTQTDKQLLLVEVFHEMERRDENQILAEMRGEILEDLVYSTDIQGRRVTNLSYAGVKEAVRRRGNLEILEARTEETDDEIRALVRVRDHENRIDVLGASSAEKGKPFSYTLAVNKGELRIIQERGENERLGEELKSGGGRIVARMKLYFVLAAVLGAIALLEFFMSNSPAIDPIVRMQLPPVVGTLLTLVAILAGLLKSRKRIARILFLTGDTGNQW